MPKRTKLPIALTIAGSDSGRFYNGQGSFNEYTVGGVIKTRVGKTKINANAKFTLADGIDRRVGVYSNAAGVVTGERAAFHRSRPSASRATKSAAMSNSRWRPS